MGDVFDSLDDEKKRTNPYKRLPKKTKEEECEEKSSKKRYRPVHNSISLPLSTIQKLASSKAAVPPFAKESDCTKKPILTRHTPKISSQKTEGKKWLFSRNRKVEISEKNIENRSPRIITAPTLGFRKRIEVSTERRNGKINVVNSSNVTVRRGQTSNKLDGQIHTPESLSRSSSVTNLNVVDQTSTPKVKSGGTKPRKSASRDKLDKIGTGTGTTERRNERKGVTKNNNKFDSGDTALALDSLQEIESLRAQLHQMATEKSNLALELGEQKGHIHSLQHQIENLKMYQEQSNLQLEQLTEENTALRNRLRDVAHSPLSDNEKQQLLYESHRHHNSAPASIATNPLDDGTCGDVTACPTPDWDKHSSGNVSEVSVACLQDKINQMQETHYSTNEELQATLQELTDLQKQLTELQQENERLSEEKNLMFDSLCRQTERLKDTRQEVESLKTLLYREKNEPGVETAQEREEKLVDLLKSAQDEHESLLSKHEQMSVELQELRDANEALQDQLKVLSDRNVTLESTLDAKHAEHKLLDQELALAKDQSSGRQIEINRLKDLLENARTKIIELEQDRAMSDKSELDELLDNARKEKDSLESEVAHLKEKLARSKNEIEKLKEQVSILQEECKVTRNNARTIQSDLEYKCEKLVSEKSLLTEQLHNFQDVMNELQVQAQCQVEDKRNLSDVLAETQRNLCESERKIISLQNELADVKKLRRDENEEWEKFQNDLLTSVRVANDFKTEAQQDLQKMIMENKEHRDKVRQLEAQLDKLKGDSSSSVEMTKGRRSSQTFPKQTQQKTIFGSLPNILDAFSSERDPTVKKTKRVKGSGHQKQLSLEEGKILDTLDKMYRDIDPNTPEDQLTTEQVVIRKLKTLYEDQSVSYRPVAPRNKGDLAISKPLLESVYSNPKLQNIVNNPDIKCLETDRFSWLGHKKFADEELETPEASPRTSTMHKNKNRSNFYVESEPVFDLKRYSSKEDLSGALKTEEKFDEPLKNKSARKRSSLKSTNSDCSSNYSQKKRVSFDEGRNSCFLIKEFLSRESLEDIFKTIDPKIPEQQLSKEQRFALRVKISCSNLGEKPELRKRYTFKRNKVTISLPTQESVMRNTKLRCIINDPIVRTAGEHPEEQETVELRNLKRMRKYLADTNIVMGRSKQEKIRTNFCKNDPRLSTSLEDIGKRVPFRFDRPYSSMENLESCPAHGIMNSDVQIKVTTNVLPAKSFASSFVFSSSSSSVDNSVETLMEETVEAPVMFVEHFEPEKVEVRKRDRVEIREMSANSIIRDSQSTEVYTGRISFPNDDDLVIDHNGTRFSVICVEINDHDAPSIENEPHVEVEQKCVEEMPMEVHESRQSMILATKEKDLYISSDTQPNNEILETEFIYFSDRQDNAEVDISRNSAISYASSSSDNTNISEEPEDSVRSSGTKSNRISDISCESSEGEQRKEVKARYGAVVQEIKRKYSSSLQCPSDTSDEEEINIFSPKEGKIEVRKLSREDEASNNSFLDTFFNVSNIFSPNITNLGSEIEDSDEKSGKLFLELERSEIEEETEPSKQILEESNTLVPLEEKQFIKYVRQVYEEDFKDIDVLGYVSDNDEPKRSQEVNEDEECKSEKDLILSFKNKVRRSQEEECKSAKDLILSFENKVRRSVELSAPITSPKNIKNLIFDITERNSDVFSVRYGEDNQSLIPPEADIYLSGKNSEDTESTSRIASEIVLPDIEKFSNTVVQLEKVSSIENEENPEPPCDTLKYVVDEYNFGTIVEKIKIETEKPTPLTFDSINSLIKSSEDLHYILPESEYSNYEQSVIEKENENTNSNESIEKVGEEIFEQLSTKELDLVSSLKKRNSRPISAINMDDVAFIEAMKRKYLNYDNVQDSQQSDASLNDDFNVTLLSGDLKPEYDDVTLSVVDTSVSGINKDFDESHIHLDNCRGFAETLNEFLINERLNYFSSSRFSSMKEEKPDNKELPTNNEIVFANTENYASAQDRSEKNNFTYFSVEEFAAINEDFRESQFVSKKKLILGTPRNSFELENSAAINSNRKISNVSLSSQDQVQRTSLEYISYEPLYENYNEILKKQLKNHENISRKPKPLPRNFHTVTAREQFFNEPVTRDYMNRERLTISSMKPENFPYVNVVKIENENHEPLPNYSEVMDRNDDIGMKSKEDINIDTCSKSYSNDPASTPKPGVEIEESTSSYVNDALSSNILVRKTKKFIKDGNQVEEFDEAAGVANVELENLPDFDKFDSSKQLIPEDLIDYVDSSSKITLFSNNLKDANPYFEPCSRPQTSRQAPATFRLSCYGQNSNDSIDPKHDPSPRRSNDMVAQLREKFENLADENNDSKRNSVNSGEYVEARRSNLPKLFKEKDAYDLVFKTNSKYWFDNNSEKSDAAIRQSAPSFEPTTSTTPLNITILDPVESKTNTNYQHLFDVDPLGSAMQKPFVDAGQLSELNLKTSIPCVDFTTLPMIEKESNASLYDFGSERPPNSDVNSDGEKVGRLAKKEPS